LEETLRIYGYSMNNPKDFYNEINQERRCQVGLHNFPTYDNDNELLVCKRCFYMQLPYDPYDELSEKDKKIVETFKNIHLGHKP